MACKHKREVSRFFDDFCVSIVYDASAKIPSGVLSGNINQLGDFDECSNVNAPNSEFTGKYCLTYVQITVPDYLPKLRKLRKLLQSHDAFVNDFDDVSICSTIEFSIFQFFSSHCPKSNYGQVHNRISFNSHFYGELNRNKIEKMNL